jgi:hypothetical protein
MILEFIGGPLDGETYCPHPSERLGNRIAAVLLPPTDMVAVSPIPDGVTPSNPNIIQHLYELRDGAFRYAGT